MSRTVGSLRFRPRAVPTLAALAVALLTLYLGHWQQGRAAEKRALQTQFELRAGEPTVELSGASRDPALRYRKAVARGEWLIDRQIFVDNKVNDGIAGYHVITPLKLASGDTVVLVNRGWVPRGPRYPAPPEAPVSGGALVAGLLTQPSSRFLELSSQAVQGNVWQNLTVARFREATGLDVLPFVLLADRAAPPLKAVVEHPDAGTDKHIEYMMTWYSLAATVLVLWIALNIERGAPQKKGQA